MTTAPATFTTPAIGEVTLTLLRMLDKASDQTLAQSHSAYGDVQQALIRILESQGWGRNQAQEAIHHALNEGVTLKKAMEATQAG